MIPNMENHKTLGMIAGSGRLPVIVAQNAKNAGCKVICVGLGDIFDENLHSKVDVFYPVPLGRPGKWIKQLKKHHVTKTIMVGKVEKKRQFAPFRLLKLLPDWRAIRIWYIRLKDKDKRPETVLSALADELTSGGIILENSTMYSEKDLAEEGLLTKKNINANIQNDIEFGWKIAKKIGEADIGQAVTVKEQETIAVEAIEGTAEMIERTGHLCRKGWTLVKVARPVQDMRFDVPCIGTETIKSVHENGGKCIVLEAGKTFIIDKSETIELANKLGIVIIGKEN